MSFHNIFSSGLSYQSVSKFRNDQCSWLQTIFSSNRTWILSGTYITQRCKFTCIFVIDQIRYFRRSKSQSGRLLLQNHSSSFVFCQTYLRSFRCGKLCNFLCQRNQTRIEQFFYFHRRGGKQSRSVFFHLCLQNHQTWSYTSEDNLHSTAHPDFSQCPNIHLE